MAIAGSCIISANALAGTFYGTFQMANVPQYKITFYQNTVNKFFGEQPEPEGKCRFCWLSDCYDFTYNWDGDKLVYIYNVGLYIIMNKTLFEIPFTKSFDKIN